MANVFDRLDRIEKNQAQGKRDKRSALDRLDQIQPVKDTAKKESSAQKNPARTSGGGSTANSVQASKTALSGNRSGTSRGRGFAGEKTTLAQRVADTVIGGAKGALGADINAAAALYDGTKNARNKVSQVYVEDAQRGMEEARYALALMKEDNRKQPGTWTEKDLAQQQGIIDDWAGKLDVYGKAARAQRGATQESYQLADRVQAAAAQDVERAKAGLGGAGRVLVDAGASMTQTAMDAAANLLTGGASMAPFAFRAFGGGTQQARQDNPDSTLGQQLAYGAASAAKEVFTEKMFNLALPFAKAYGGGALDDVVARGIRKAVDHFAKTDAGKRALGGALTFGAGAVSEGLEELIGDWMEWQMPRIYGGDVASAGETLESSLYDFLVGAVSGAMGGVISPGTYQYDIGDTAGARQDAAMDNAYRAMSENGMFSREADAAREQARDSLGMPQRSTERQGYTTPAEAQNNAQDGDRALLETARSMTREQQETDSRNGQTAEQDESRIVRDLQYNMERVRRAAGALGESGGKALTAAYTEDTAKTIAPKEAVEGFYKVYNAALKGENLADTDARSAAALPAHLRYAAQSAGQQDALRAKQAQFFGEKAGLVKDDSWKKAHLSSKTNRTLDALGKALGVQVQFAETVADGQANAQYGNGVITLALDAKDPVLTSTVHEAVHRIRETSPEAYNTLAEFVQQTMTAEGLDFNLEERAKLYGTENVSDLTEEMVADAFGRMIGNEETVTSFVKEHRNVAQKVMDVLRDIVNAVKRVLNHQNLQLTQEQRAAFQDLEGRFGDMEKLFEDALKKAEAQRAKPLQDQNSDATMGTTRNSLKEDLENGRARKEARAAFLQRSAGEGYAVYEGKTAAYGYRNVSGRSAQGNARQVQEEVKKLGINAEIIDGPLLWNRDGVTGTREVKQAVTVGRARIFINNAATISPRNIAGHEAFHLWRSGTGRDAYIETVEDNLLFTSEAFREYQSAIAEAYLGGEADLNNDAQMEKLREELFAYISGDIHEGVYDDFLRPMFRDFDAVKAAWNELVALNNGTKFSLKTDSQGRKLTETQQEFFRDSKVVDEAGQLKVMYRGGNSDFTVFDRKKSSYSNLYGRGFYFTDSEAHAKQYGNAKAFYLNITTPVSTTETTITRDQMRKFLKAVAANEDDFSFENYGYDATVSSVLKSVYGKSDFAMLYDVNQTAIGDMVAAVELFNEVNGTSYDGLILDTETVAFRSNQIKNTDNQNPTKDPDIRYSRSDRELLADYVKKHGAIPRGEKPSREITMPKKTGDGKNLSRTVRTILEAGATPEELVPSIEKLAARGDFSYDTYTDKQAIDDAESKIRKVGWGQALGDWMADMKKGEVSKANTAMGWALYNNAANSGDTKTALTILENMVEHQRSAAQALQATRILKKMSPETQLYGVQRSVENLQEELNSRYGKKKGPELKIDQELAERFMQAKDQTERDEALKEIYRDIGRQMPSTFLDKWNAWRYLSMLGNPRTHVRNIVGNAGFMPVVATKNLVGTAIESAVYRVSGGKLNRSKALVWGGKQDRALLSAAWGDYAKVQEAALGGGKYSDFANANKYIEEGRKIFNTKPLETFRKANSAALDVEDVWFSKPHYAYALSQYCKAHGITEEQIASGKGLKAAREYAILEAQKATYRDTNALSQAISELGRANMNSKNPVKKGIATLAEGILPFRKTPANILARGLEYSPLGFGKGIKEAVWDVSRGNKTAAEAIDSISAGLTGTGLLMLGIYLASQGLVRGSGGDDDKKKKFEELQGHQDYALELPDGTSVTLDWLAPECLPFFVGVNLWENTEGERATLSDWLTAATTVTDPLLSMSCLQSLNDVFDTVSNVSNGGLEGLPAALSSAATSYLTQALPTLLGQVERTGEDKRYTTYTEKNAFLTGDMQYILGKASARIPGWDYNQIPYIDAWGRTEASGSVGYRAANNFLNPAYLSKIEASDMENELLRLYEATGEAGVLPQRADKSFTVGNEKKELTGEEYVTYATVKGRTAHELLTDLVKSKEYKAMSDEDKVTAVSNVYKAANQTAKAAISDYEPEAWIRNAREAEKKYGIDQETYILLKTQTGGIESMKDKNGETITNSKGLLIMQEIYNTPGLTDKQRQAMFEYLGVGKTIRHYNPGKVKQELEKMKKK